MRTKNNCKAMVTCLHCQSRKVPGLDGGPWIEIYRRWRQVVWLPGRQFAKMEIALHPARAAIGCPCCGTFESRTSKIKPRDTRETSFLYYGHGCRRREDDALGAALRSSGRGLLEADPDGNARRLGPGNGDAARGHRDRPHTGRSVQICAAGFAGPGRALGRRG